MIQRRIKGLSDIRRLPRLGKIRLGIKVQHPTKKDKEGNPITYPREVHYFVCPAEVQDKYGPQPTWLDIMFPMEDEHACAPQNYKAYVFQGLRCKGDGERAMRRVADLKWIKDGKVLDDATERVAEGQNMADPNSMVEIACPCNLLETGDCRQSANLMVLLPKVSMGGVYQVDTGSYHNIIRINSSVDYLRGMVGRIALVPLILHRQQEEIQYEGKKAKHYLLQITLNANLEEVAMLREHTKKILTDTARIALPTPVDEGVDTAPGAIIIEGDVEEEHAEEAVPPVREADRVEPAQQTGPEPPRGVPQAQAEAGTQADQVVKAQEIQQMLTVELRAQSSLEKLDKQWGNRIPLIEQLKEVLGDEQGVEPLRLVYLERKKQLQEKAGKKGQGKML